MELVGIEAVSRGAKKAILCDKSQEAVAIIQKNIEKTHTKTETEVYQTTFEDLLKNKIKEKKNIIYIDPPYKSDFAYEAVKLILDYNLLSENSIIIIETDQEKRVMEQLKDLRIEIIKQKKYGRAYLIFLTKKK